uniref:Uncharacterized protein n=1 Tax=Chromera velia CCMP2878 TaxID=1169474 RepID=A0A0G4GHP0_9ALVE|eukprot:Cvel_21930.t1-p1 / transcript=Cvel_21930.t1 / gene=Cvel_21930 / organism=Chromera_velia_CCMP2878 / gene_product=hypothetical protein / transcript_product=hypothetical protein / location=Cvel_scaffold2103:21112-32823(-) / protein_length=75 / sequence_SO=supercontig / SO=protein_coding / is_pseudo=false
MLLDPLTDQSLQPLPLPLPTPCMLKEVPEKERGDNKELLMQEKIWVYAKCIADRSLELSLASGVRKELRSSRFFS